MQSASGKSNPKVAIVVSDESRDYRAEMEWLAEQLQVRGHQIFCAEPRDLMFMEGEAFLKRAVGRIQIDVVYRFMELYDLPNVPKSELLLYAAKARAIALTPPIKPQLEEKLWFALLHHPVLALYWEKHLGTDTFCLLRRVMPPTWILDPEPLPVQAAIPGLIVKGRNIHSWMEVCEAGKVDRRLVVKPSGFSSEAWGSKGVVIGHDCSSEAWADAVQRALAQFPRTTSVIQEFRSGRRVRTAYFSKEKGTFTGLEGRVRLTPYYFSVQGQLRLSAIMATICPLDKKKLHGMRDAVIVPCALATASSSDALAGPI